MTGVWWNAPARAGLAWDSGFCVNGSGPVSNIKLPTTQVGVSSNISLVRDGLQVKGSTTAQWNNGYCRQIFIENIGTTEITNWSLSMGFSGTIEPWSANWIRTSDGRYRITPVWWNTVLTPNRKHEIGFCGNNLEQDRDWRIESVSKENVTTAPTAINGACGSANNFQYSTTATSYAPRSQCASGTPSTTDFPAVGGNVNWVCNGSNSGINSSVCRASRAPATTSPQPTAVNGTCGSANGFQYPSNATSYTPQVQCSSGTPSTTTFPATGASVSWTCSGSNGGVNSSCRASRASGVTSPVANTVQNYRIVAIGDSLTQAPQGWRGPLIRALEARGKTVTMMGPLYNNPINMTTNGAHAGYGGYATGPDDTAGMTYNNVYDQLDAIQRSSSDVNTVIIVLGTNDYRELSLYKNRMKNFAIESARRW